MQRIVIVGGGVGGTLIANLLARELGRQIDRGEVNMTVVDRRASTSTSPGSCTSPWGTRSRRAWSVPSARCSTSGSTSRWAR